MKQINTYINEKLRLSAKPQYTCQPKSKDELRQIILQRIEDEDPNCDLNDIDTSKIKDMSFLFDTRNYTIFKDFNGDISMWNVSNVIYMQSLFHGCEKFNCDISQWNVSKVENMYNMFNKCISFNQDLSHWNISNVEDIGGMFEKCMKFDCDLSTWDVSNVKYMRYAFYNCPTKPTWYDRKRWEY